MKHDICWELDYQTDGKFSLIQMWEPSQLLKIHNAINVESLPCEENCFSSGKKIIKNSPSMLFCL